LAHRRCHSPRSSGCQVSPVLNRLLVSCRLTWCCLGFILALRWVLGQGYFTDAVGAGHHAPWHNSMCPWFLFWVMFSVEPRSKVNASKQSIWTSREPDKTKKEHGTRPKTNSVMSYSTKEYAPFLRWPFFVLPFAFIQSPSHYYLCHCSYFSLKILPNTALPIASQSSYLAGFPANRHATEMKEWVLLRCTSCIISHLGQRLAPFRFLFFLCFVFACSAMSFFWQSWSLFRCGYGYGYGYGLKWDHGLTMAMSS
jgi:hypothetical protein